MKTTPKEYQKKEKVNRIISKGNIPVRRNEINESTALQMLDEMCSQKPPIKTN